MKKLDLIMLITGLCSLVLSVILTVVLVFVFSAAVKSEIQSGKIEESFQKIGDFFEEKFNDGAIVVDGETIVDFSNGIHVDDGDTKVDINSNGIHVVDSTNEVNVSPSGIAVDSAEG